MAAGGAALIVLESMYVHPAGKNHRCQLGIHDDDLVPGYRRLIEACHRHGALVGAELQFAGRETWHRPMVLDQGLSASPWTLTPAEMDFLNSSKMTRDYRPCSVMDCASRDTTSTSRCGTRRVSLAANATNSA